jgi:vacuolar protein sorting-associated protein 35|mmetsp:Transcript_56467/g.89478  ORF Transcript_56467/g.89478 Transcript_56467/m.89478 type:complete len:821 (-) Transcript_56467:37-2499(-)
MATGAYVAGGGDDQDRLLDEATAVVKEQAFYMKRAIDNDSLREALKHASNLVCELRTSLLSPKNYYELYMSVFQELQHISAFFGDRSRHNRKMVDLYESVQHAGNILPRLYLLSTVGASYIKSGEAPAKEILKDMSELCKGVQHPTRGLFLRYYLAQMVKDKLPDTGSEYEEMDGGTIDDAVDFVLANFEESNRLWVRIQHQGPQRDKQKREKERHELRVLVGYNLVRLSQLDGLTVEYYQEKVLPRLLDHILSVKETMSQQYLFESMIQVFADTYHIHTLEQLLASYAKASPSVDMKPIMVALMKRLGDFLTSEEAQSGNHALAGVDIFSLFRTHLQAILERTLEPGASGGTPDIAAPLELQAAFMQFTLSLYPDKAHYVDIILGSTVQILQKYFDRLSESGSTTRKISGLGAEKVVALMTEPLKFFQLQVLDMEQYPILLDHLKFETRKDFAKEMITIVVKNNITLDTVEAVNSLFEFVQVLIKDVDDTPADEKKDKETFAFEQKHVSGLVHQLKPATPDDHNQMLMAVRNFFGMGGPDRIGFTLPCVVHSAFALINKLQNFQLKYAEMQESGVDEEELPEKPQISIKKVFQFIHKTTTKLNDVVPEIAMQLWLLAATMASRCDEEGNYEPICYEFLTQALLVFEEEINDSKKQFDAIHQLIGTYAKLECLEDENRENVTGKIVQHSQKLLKKPMQCRAIAACANLYITTDGTKVLQCCQKALKICDASVTQDPKVCGLWVEMLDKYVLFFEKGIEEVTAKYINSLIPLCQEHIEFASGTEDSKAEAKKASVHYTSTLQYIRRLQKENPDKYGEISLP